MDFLKKLFEQGAIDWDTFVKAVADNGYKLADLSKGEYVSKNKYDDDLKTKDEQITTLNGQISTRDNDLKTLQEKMQNAQNNDTALDEVNKELAKLKEDYQKAQDKYNNQIKAQAYDFAVKEFANTQTFSSSAAKREFIHNMKDKKLNMEDGKLIGANDYLEAYKKDNEDSFVTETKIEKPTFTQGTSPQSGKKEEINPFLDTFQFSNLKNIKE